MKNVTALAMLGAVLLEGVGLAGAGEKAPQKVVDFAQSTLVKLGADPVIVQAVKAENAKGKTLEQITALDKQWMETPGVTDYMRALMASECGQHLRRLQQAAAYYAEIFVMDNQGANEGGV